MLRGRPATAPMDPQTVRRRTSQSRTKRSIEKRSRAVARPASPTARQFGIGEQGVHHLDELLRVRVDESVHTVVDDVRQLGRSEAHHRKTDAHGLAQREAQARVTHWMEVEAVGGQEAGQVGGRTSPSPPMRSEAMPTRSSGTRSRARANTSAPSRRPRAWRSLMTETPRAR